MEKIHKRKPQTDTGPHRPQELSHLHDNEGTKRTTSTMDARIKSIKLQNRIPTRKGGRKTRRPHKKRRRPTHSGRQETHSKRGNLTTKGSILGHPRDRRNKARHIGNNRIPRQGDGEIEKGSKNDNEIPDIKRNLDEGKTEMKGTALGLCQWKDDLLWYQGKIWIPNDEGIRTALIAKHHDPPQAGHEGTAKTTKLMNRRYYWPKI